MLDAAHTCHVYESPQEAIEVAVRFLAEGLAAGERCAFVGPEGARTAVGEALARSRGAREDAVLLLRDTELFLPAGGLDPDAPSESLRDAAQAARASGFARLRVVSDTSRVLGASPAVEALIEYAARLDAIVRETGMLALCQYDRRALPAEIVRGAMRVHEHVLHGGRLLRNLHAVPPAALLQRETAEAEVERLLSALHAREEAEEALRASERRHRLLTENAADVIFRYRLGPTGGYDYVSPSCTGLLGYTPEEYYADPLLALRLVHPDDRGRVERGLTGSPTPDHVVLRWIAKDGRTVWIEQRNVLVRDEDGRVVAFEGVARDVTARKLAEDALRESEERLRIALESAGHMFWEYDLATGRVTSADSPMLLGYRADRIGSVDDWTALVHPDDRGRMLSALQAHLSGETPHYRCEYRARDASGEWKWVLASGRIRARDDAGRPLRMAGTLTDVTETRELRVRLQVADRLASVGTLAAGVAHEINNPLAFVTSNVGYVRDELARLARANEAAAPLAQLDDALRDALDGTARVRGIVQGLRQFAQPARDANRARIDVRAEIAAAVRLARNEVAHRATLALDLAEDLPPVEAAPHELGQIVVNLLVNAAQAIPEGRAAWNEVRVSARAAGGTVTIEVRDSGAGIPAEALPHIFDPFFTTKPVGSGTGLGLSICHGIVVALGGKIDVETSAGEGTTFRVVLPAAAPAPAPAPAAARADTPPPRRARVLVVDDEPLVGRSLVRLLQSAHDVTAVVSPAEAVARIAAGERWDVVLCDLMMPDMSGMDLEARIRDAAPEVVGRIVYMTGGAFTERARTFLDEGRPWLEKPIDAAVLKAKIAEIAAGDAGRAG